MYGRILKTRYYWLLFFAIGDLTGLSGLPQSTTPAKAPAQRKASTSSKTPPTVPPKTDEISAPATQVQPAGMTVDDVMKMVQVKLADDLIISQLRKNGKVFSLSTDDLVRLKTAGASDNVVRVMIDPKAPIETPPPPATVVNSAPPATPKETPPAAEPKLELGVYARRGEAWIEVPPEVVHFKTSRVFKVYAGKLDINGNISAASSKTTLRTPIEIMLMTAEGVNASEYQLLRLRSKGHSREFRVARSGFMGSKSGVERDAVAFEFKKVGPGQYTIGLPSSVVAGEYAFLPPMGVAGSGVGGIGASMGKAYTFHVLE